MPGTGQTMVGADDPRALIWNLIRGPWQYAALHALVVLGCADHLAVGPLTTQDLAARCGADGEGLGRLLTYAATVGLLDQPAPGRYALTQAGQVLRADVTGSMRAAVLATGEAAGWQAMIGLDHTARTGQPAFAAQQGSSFYDYLAAHPAQARIFQEFMTSRSAGIAADIAALDFTHSKVVADIGGGHGTILAAILTAWPHLHGILAERQHVLDSVPGHLAATGVHDRVELAACDYLDVGQIPSADTYLLANILHNHDDHDARAILTGILAAAPEPPRVLLADILLPARPVPHFGFDLDIRMMALGTGRERTRAAYLSLLSDAGLTNTTITETPHVLSIIDAQPPVSQGTL
jgi:hypothetical protein